MDKFPGFALAWKDLSMLLDDDASRLHAIERGLRGRPDAETLGVLLINKAGILARQGDRDTAIAILGELALSPDSTLATEHIAKATLAALIASPRPGQSNPASQLPQRHSRTAGIRTQNILTHSPNYLTADIPGAGSVPGLWVENKTMVLRRQAVHRPKDLAAGPFAADVASFRLHLAAESKAAGTVRTCAEATLWFAAVHLLRETAKTR